MRKGLKNLKLTETRAQMTFCASCKTCPAIDKATNSYKVQIGGKEEGYTSFTKDRFAIFVDHIKSDKLNGCNPNNDEVPIAGNLDGMCIFTKDQFKLFIEEIKSGTFDKYL